MRVLHDELIKSGVDSALIDAADFDSSIVTIILFASCILVFSAMGLLLLQNMAVS